MNFQSITCDFTTDGIKEERQPEASSSNSDNGGDNICWSDVSRPRMEWDVMEGSRHHTYVCHGEQVCPSLAGQKRKQESKKTNEEKSSAKIY